MLPGPIHHHYETSPSITHPLLPSALCPPPPPSRNLTPHQGETPGEIAGLARAMLDKGLKVDTGMDGEDGVERPGGAKRRSHRGQQCKGQWGGSTLNDSASL